MRDEAGHIGVVQEIIVVRPEPIYMISYMEASRERRAIPHKRLSSVYYGEDMREEAVLTLDLNSDSPVHEIKEVLRKAIDLYDMKPLDLQEIAYWLESDDEV